MSRAYFLLVSTQRPHTCMHCHNLFTQRSWHIVDWSVTRRKFSISQFGQRRLDWLLLFRIFLVEEPWTISNSCNLCGGWQTYPLRSERYLLDNGSSRRDTFLTRPTTRFLEEGVFTYAFTFDRSRYRRKNVWHLVLSALLKPPLGGDDLIISFKLLLHDCFLDSREMYTR